jgi:uncharacterized membrane protein YfcA
MDSMTLGSLIIIAITIVGTSFISGIFGMAGGMILLGVLLVFFDVVAGMVLFSTIQLAANGWRAVLWWRFVRWPIFWRYVAGAFLAFLAMRAIAFVPDKALVYLALGAMPFLIEMLPAAARPNIEWRGVPFFTGVTTTLVQLISGVGGQFLDIFFQKSELDRKTTVATKAVTQTFAHLLRLLYFSSLAGASELVPLWAHAPAIALAILGTSLAPFVLERLTDAGFRQWTRWIILVISVVYLGRGLWLLVQS